MTSRSIVAIFACALVACSGEDDDAPPTMRDAGATSVRDGGPRDGGASTDRDAGPPDGGVGEGPMGCLDLTTDRAVDLAIQPSVEATVTLTMNGAEPPAAMGLRGLFSIRNPTWGSGAALPVMTMSGPVVLESDVLEGDHDAVFVSGACSPPDALPYCARATAHLAVSAGANAVDFAYGPLDVTFTLDGQPFPEGDPNLLGRADVVFAARGDDASFTRSFRVPPTGPMRVATGAYVGTYDVVITSRFLCDSGVLCGGGIVGSVTIDAQSTPSTIDVRSVAITGHVTKDGGAFLDLGSPPAVVSFRALDAASAIGSARLDASGDYALRLVRGRYDVEFAGFANGPPPGNPVSQVIVLRERELVADGAVDFDVATADVTVGFTKNGQPLDLGDGGTIVFSTPDGEGSIFLDIPETEVDSWARNVVAERYDARFIPPADCEPDDGLPCVAAYFARDVDFTVATTTLLDITSHAVTIDVTLGGAPLAQPSSGPGVLHVAPTELTGQVELRVPSVGPTVVRTRLAPGTYRAEFAPSIGCAAGELGAMPCAPIDLGTFEVAGDTDVVLDIDAVHVSGTVLIGDEEVPVLPDAAPWLRFTTPDGHGYPVQLGVFGAFEIDVPAGSYAVAYESRSLCVGRNVPAPRPCASQVIHACAE